MALRSGVWAILFTDMVGSTEQRARLGDKAGDGLRREHDAIVSRVLAVHRGERVEGTGDGAMCAFASAADALAASVSLQQTIDRRNDVAEESLKLRVGVSLGEFVYDEAGLMGLAAHEAARICALCDAGEVLVSDLVRVVAGSRTDCEFVARGDFELKGFPAAVTVWEVAWNPAPIPAPLPLPSLLVPPNAVAFSGREAELARMLVLWRDAVQGSRRAALVVGEPGIGKTRLAAETARIAHGEGALVLYGRCDDELGVPFQPFAEALDWYLERADEPTVGRHPEDLARLSLRLADRVPSTARPSSGDPESERYRLFDAVASWISTLADEQPVALVLDDVHWATKPTLLMLRHLVRVDSDARLLVIATYRDTELDRDHPLHAMLPELSKLSFVERVTLSGLDEAGVVNLLERVGEQEVDERMRSFARVLIGETEGNPFFIGEVLQHLVESGTLVRGAGGWISEVGVEELGIPRGVTEVLRQRLQHLGSDATDVLQAAAIVGRAFTLDVVVAAAATPEDATFRVLDNALTARLVEETGPDEYRFAHALVRTALEGEVSTSRRRRLHRRIVEHLETTRPGDLPALAYHGLEAARAGEPGNAVEYARRAGDQALAKLAPDEAADWYVRALEVLDRSPVPDAAASLAMLECLGDAQLAIGDPDEYRPTWRRAAETALDVDDDVAYARAILGYVGRPETMTSLDDYARAGLDVALERLHADERSLRVRLLGALASGITNFEPERATQLSVESLDLARKVGAQDLIADAIRARLRCWWDPLAFEERLVLVTEMREMATATDNGDLLAQSWQWQSVVALESGDLAGLATAADEIERVNERLGLRYFRWAVAARRAALALSRGAFDDAERLIFDAHELESHGFSAFATQFGILRWLQGRGAELDGLVPLDSRGAVGHVLRAMRANLAVETGRVADARPLLGALAEEIDDLARYKLVMTSTAAMATRAAVGAGPGPWVDALLALLQPLEGRFAVVNPAATSLGAIEGLLGPLAALANDPSRAEMLLRRAIERNRAAGLEPFVAIALADLADVLAQSATDQARVAANEAHELAARLGMHQIAQRAMEVARRCEARP